MSVLPVVILIEFERDGVHAVAQAGRSRAVVEDVAEMRSTPLTYDFRARHAVSAIYVFVHAPLAEGLVKTGPARA